MIRGGYFKTLGVIAKQSIVPFSGVLNSPLYDYKDEDGNTKSISGREYFGLDKTTSIIDKDYDKEGYDPRIVSTQYQIGYDPDFIKQLNEIEEKKLKIYRIIVNSLPANRTRELNDLKDEYSKKLAELEKLILSRGVGVSVGDARKESADDIYKKNVDDVRKRSVYKNALATLSSLEGKTNDANTIGMLSDELKKVKLREPETTKLNNLISDKSNLEAEQKKLEHQKGIHEKAVRIIAQDEYAYTALYNWKEDLGYERQLAQKNPPSPENDAELNELQGDIDILKGRLDKLKNFQQDTIKSAKEEMAIWALEKRLRSDQKIPERVDPDLKAISEKLDGVRDSNGKVQTKGLRQKVDDAKKGIEKIENSVEYISSLPQGDYMMMARRKTDDKVTVAGKEYSSQSTEKMTWKKYYEWQLGEFTKSGGGVEVGELHAAAGRISKGWKAWWQDYPAELLQLNYDAKKGEISYKESMKLQAYWTDSKQDFWGPWVSRMVLGVNKSTAGGLSKDGLIAKVFDDDFMLYYRFTQKSQAYGKLKKQIETGIFATILKTGSFGIGFTDPNKDVDKQGKPMPFGVGPIKFFTNFGGDPAGIKDVRNEWLQWALRIKVQRDGRYVNRFSYAISSAGRTTTDKFVRSGLGKFLYLDQNYPKDKRLTKSNRVGTRIGGTLTDLAFWTVYGGFERIVVSVNTVTKNIPVVGKITSSIESFVHAPFKGAILTPVTGAIDIVSGLGFGAVKGSLLFGVSAVVGSATIIGPVGGVVLGTAWGVQGFAKSVFGDGVANGVLKLSGVRVDPNILGTYINKGNYRGFLGGKTAAAGSQFVELTKEFWMPGGKVGGVLQAGKWVPHGLYGKTYGSVKEMLDARALISGDRLATFGRFRPWGFNKFAEAYLALKYDVGTLKFMNPLIRGLGEKFGIKGVLAETVGSAGGISKVGLLNVVTSTTKNSLLSAVVVGLIAPQYAIPAGIIMGLGNAASKLVLNQEAFRALLAFTPVSDDIIVRHIARGLINMNIVYEAFPLIDSMGLYMGGTWTYDNVVTPILRGHWKQALWGGDAILSEQDLGNGMRAVTTAHYTGLLTSTGLQQGVSFFLYGYVPGLVGIEMWSRTIIVKMAANSDIYSGFLKYDRLVFNIPYNPNYYRAMYGVNVPSGFQSTMTLSSYEKLSFAKRKIVDKFFPEFAQNIKSRQPWILRMRGGKDYYDFLQEKSIALKLQLDPKIAWNIGKTVASESLAIGAGNVFVRYALGGVFQQGFARIILGNEFVAGFRKFVVGKIGSTDDLAIEFFTGKGASVKLGGVLGFLENGLSNMKWYLALVERGGIIGKFFGGINAAFTKIGLFPARAILKPILVGDPLPFIGGFAGDMFGRFLNSTILSSINLGYAGGFLNAVGWSTLGTGVGIGAAAAIAGGSFFVAAPVLIIGGALVGITYVVSIFTGNGIPWVDTWLAKIFGGAGGLSAFAQFSFFFQITRIWASITKGDFLQLVISYFNLLMTISAMGIPLIIVTTTIMPAYTPGATDNMAIGANIPNSTWAFEEYGADIADATNAASSSIVYDEAKYGPLDNCTTMRYPMRQKYAVTAGFPKYPDGGKHGGVDFGVPLGNDILASCPGIVVATNTGSPNTYGCTEAGPRCFYGYGNVVKLLVRYQDRMYEIYTAHLSSVKVNAGDKIEKGQILGLSGNSGNSSGPHLHFEIRPAGTYNPLQPCGFIDCAGNSIDNSSDSDVAKTYTLAEIASAGYSLEVSNTKCLPSDYAPSDLRTVGVSSNPNSNRLRIDAARALESMFEDAKQKGVTLYLRSAYRSYDQQQDSYGAYGDELAAKPGCSEHQLGLAVDILGGANCDFDDNPTQGFSSCNRGAYAYLQQNASKYGFTLSYPIGNSQYRYEPWHYRYR